MKSYLGALLALTAAALPGFSTFRNAALQFGTPKSYWDPRSLLRIAIGFAF